MYFYESKSEDQQTYLIATGKDKFENDLLIKHSFRALNYVWFHADKYSSGHIYLQLKPNQKSLDEVSSDVVNDCLQLCKASSIQGNKMTNCTIVITPWHNLRKSAYMKPGEVSFKTTKALRKKECFARDNKVLNRLEKTRIEVFENLEALLHEGKKSKNETFFEEYLANNREKLIEEERARKQEKKLSKKKKKLEDLTDIDVESESSPLDI